MALLRPFSNSTNVSWGQSRSWRLLPGDYFPGMLDEGEQNLERLLVKLDADALLAQLSRPGIHLERAETNRRL